jgi:3-oxoacyl-[acyl-carrier protein] reductase
MRLNNKVAIVTGAGSGFGEGIARKFVAEGAKVLLVDLRGDTAEQAAEALGGENVARAWRADVSSASDTKRIFDAAERFFGPLDILVNNAGIGHKPQPLEGLDEHEFDRIVAVNMKSIYLAMREAVPRFKARAADARGLRGVVLNIASTAGVSPRPRLCWYNASKGWVITATRASAVELAPQGIRVNALNPVAGETLGHLHGRRHAGDARQVLVHHSDRPLLHARRPRQRGLLPVQRRSLDGHRRVHGS